MTMNINDCQVRIDYIVNTLMLHRKFILKYERIYEDESASYNMKPFSMYSMLGFLSLMSEDSKEVVRLKLKQDHNWDIHLPAIATRGKDGAGFLKNVSLNFRWVFLSIHDRPGWYYIRTRQIPTQCGGVMLNLTHQKDISTESFNDSLRENTANNRWDMFGSSGDPDYDSEEDSCRDGEQFPLGIQYIEHSNHAVTSAMADLLKVTYETYYEGCTIKTIRANGHTILSCLDSSYEDTSMEGYYEDDWDTVIENTTNESHISSELSLRDAYPTVKYSGSTLIKYECGYGVRTLTGVGFSIRQLGDAIERDALEKLLKLATINFINNLPACNTYLITDNLISNEHTLNGSNESKGIIMYMMEGLTETDREELNIHIIPRSTNPNEYAHYIGGVVICR